MAPVLLALLAPASAQEAPAPAEEPPPLTKRPELLDFVQAPYPAEAQAAGLEAIVRLLLEIDANGAVTNVEVLAPAGHGFDEAAADAARRFRFSPAEDATGPVPVVVEFDYGFRLAPEPPPPDATEAPLQLEGQLRERVTRVPLANAAVQVLVGDQVVATATTDAEGRFALRGLPYGEARVAGYTADHLREEATVTLAEGEVTTVTLWVARLSYRDEGIVGVYDKERPPEVTRRTLSMAEVRRVPGTFGDPVRVVQSLPGAARAPFGLGLLVLRGANPEDSNVYVDGVEVPLVYHLGGFRSILNPDLIDAVDYLPGTYSVRYGRSTGGVVDVRTKDTFPEDTRLVWHTDVLDSGLFAEGRLPGNVGFAVGARRSYVDAILGVALANQEFYAAPRWFDYQLKVAALDRDDDLSAFVFGFRDALVVRTDKDAEDQVGVFYGTHRVVLRWGHPLTDTLRFDLQPTLGFDTAELGFGSEVGLELRALRLLVRGDLAWTPSDAWTARVGLDGEANRTDFSIFVAGVPVDGENPLSEEEPLTFEDGIWQSFPDPWVEATWRPLADPEQLTLVGGVRLSTLVQTDADLGLALDPRLAVRARLLEQGTVKAGTGLYHQPPQGVDLGGDARFERAWASELGWEQGFGEAITADLTGFYRHMDQLGGDGEGIGRAYGMELMVRHALRDRFFGWVSYTLSRSERNDDPADPDAWYLFDFDQTHILTAVAGYRLPRDFEVSARAQYVTGNPYTPYDGGIYLMDEGGYIGFPSADENSERMAPFYAVDLRVDKLFSFKRWQLELFVDLLNAVHGENPEFILYNYDYTESAWINGLPILPSIGFQVEVRP